MFDIKTPIVAIETPFILESEVQIFMKRDDLIHQFISGNKWYKLKYNFASFEKTPLSKIATFGGAYSNHLIATAAACAMKGVPCVGIVRGEELNTNSNHVLRLCSEYGMELQFVERSTYKRPKVLTSMLKSDGFFVIPEGGDNVFGRQGCMEIVPDYTNYDHIVVPVGTAATFSGIIDGSKGNSFIHGIAAVGNGAYLLAQIRDQTSFDNWKLHTDYSFGGFGKYDAPQVNFNKQFTQQTGILLDPIYTGKMMRGVYDLINKKAFKSEDRVLCIHTGGLTGLPSGKWLNS
ncbi:MAG: 1-aminocyclopropane-1-carboxylate deaminase [bacterium]|jgi:1-aminocyclopropane-1-carboxylate deaminase